MLDQRVWAAGRPRRANQTSHLLRATNRLRLAATFQEVHCSLGRLEPYWIARGAEKPLAASVPAALDSELPEMVVPANSAAYCANWTVVQLEQAIPVRVAATWQPPAASAPAPRPLLPGLSI